MAQANFSLKYNGFFLRKPLENCTRASLVAVTLKILFTLI
jgi:hypothetical protein